MVKPIGLQFRFCWTSSQAPLDDTVIELTDEAPLSWFGMAPNSSAWPKQSLAIRTDG